MRPQRDLNPDFCDLGDVLHYSLAMITSIFILHFLVRVFSTDAHPLRVIINLHNDHIPVVDLMVQLVMHRLGFKSHSGLPMFMSLPRSPRQTSCFTPRSPNMCVYVYSTLGLLML